MKRVVIVHGWEGHPENCWYPQTRKELQEKGFVVTVPQMPDKHRPKLSSWLTKLQDVSGSPDGSLFLVGHSLGCITILRYLEQLKQNEKVGGIILVAGFPESLGQSYEPLDNFFKTKINFEKVKTKANFFTAIHSDNDTLIPLEHGDIFKEKLNAKLIVMHNMHHFSNTPVETTSLPIVTQEILRMST